ncbi:hypothetical protein GGU45_000334 [Niabella hirudinis]
MQFGDLCDLLFGECEIVNVEMWKCENVEMCECANEGFVPARRYVSWWKSEIKNTKAKLRSRSA